MMSFTEWVARNESLSNLWRGVLRASTPTLHEATTLFTFPTETVPASIARHINIAAKSNWHRYQQMSELCDTIDDARNSLSARPFLYDGKFVIAGLLPNGEDSSTDEHQAAAMLEAWRAARAFDGQTRLNCEEVPF